MKKIFNILTLLSLVIIFHSCTEKQKKEETTFKVKKEAVKTNTQAAATIPQSENKLGRRVFLLCAACHNVVKGEAHKVGPNLNGFLGSKAGMKEDFVYSEELKNKGIIWSEETLREWLSNPASYVPGTKMAFVGVKKKEQQDALIEYLKEVTVQ